MRGPPGDDRRREGMERAGGGKLGRLVWAARRKKKEKREGEREFGAQRERKKRKTF